MTGQQWDLWFWKGRQFVLLLSLLFVSPRAVAQTWTWSYEDIAPSGKQASIAVDSESNLHLSYLDDREATVKYAFRAARSHRWDTMDLGGTRGNTETYSKTVVDRAGNPHICYTPTVLEYVYYDGASWHNQQISPNAGMIQYYCALAVADDGTPHVIWYQYGNPDGSNYLHIRYAVLKDGAWLAKTLDFSGQTGKHEAITLDSLGSPHVTYDAFVDGEMRYARLVGGKWSVSTIDSRAQTLSKTQEYEVGMGSSIVLTKAGKPMISYYGTTSIRFAKFDADHWSVETIDNVSPTGSWLGWRTNLVLDHNQSPHISYEDGGTLKHAYWDGEKWHYQVIVRNRNSPHLYHSMAIGPDDALYVPFRDPSNGALKLAVGRPDFRPAPSTQASKNP
jgi:hypothetical protein